MKCYKKYVLAYDFIINNGKSTTDEDYKSLYSECNTLSSLGVDYSKELEEVSYTDNVYDKHLELMQSQHLAFKVAKALINKGTLKANNVENSELTIMVWVDEVEDNSYFFDYEIDDKQWFELANNSFEFCITDFEWKS